MNTKLLMAISSLFLGILGIILNFAPDEVAQALQLNGSSIILQMLGAVYFGFAILNWMAKANLIGGIYSRPVAFGNFAHFLIGGFSLLKMNSNQVGILIFCGFFLLFAILFGIVLFINPKNNIT